MFRVPQSWDSNQMSQSTGNPWTVSQNNKFFWPHWYTYDLWQFSQLATLITLSETKTIWLICIIQYLMKTTVPRRPTVKLTTTVPYRLSDSHPYGNQQSADPRSSGRSLRAGQPSTRQSHTVDFPVICRFLWCQQLEGGGTDQKQPPHPRKERCYPVYSLLWTHNQEGSHLKSHC